MGQIYVIEANSGSQWKTRVPITPSPRWVSIC